MSELERYHDHARGIDNLARKFQCHNHWRLEKHGRNPKKWYRLQLASDKRFVIAMVKLIEELEMEAVNS